MREIRNMYISNNVSNWHIKSNSLGKITVVCNFPVSSSTRSLRSWNTNLSQWSASAFCVWNLFLITNLSLYVIETQTGLNENNWGNLLGKEKKWPACQYKKAISVLVRKKGLELAPTRSNDAWFKVSLKPKVCF